MAEWELHASEMDFYNINNNSQIVDTRVPDPSKPEKDYSKIVPRDVLTFRLVKNGIVQSGKSDKISFAAADVRMYKTVEEMLMKEGVENVLPGVEDIEKAKRYYASLPGHAERVKANGIVAILLGERKD